MADDRLLNDPGFNQLLQKRLNVSSAPSAAVAPEIFPVFPVHDFPQDLEYLIQRRRCRGLGAVAGVAAQFSYVELRNLINSNNIVTLLSFGAVPVGSDVSLFVVKGLGPGGVAGGTLPVDTRWMRATAAGIQTSAEVRTGTAVALGTLGKEVARYNATQAANPGNVLVTISPNDSVYLMNRTANTVLTANLEWTERAAQPGEL